MTFFFSIFDNTVIVYWWGIYHDLLVFYTAFHNIPNRSWRYHQAAEQWCFCAYLIPQTSPCRAEGRDPVYFHALSGGGKMSGNRNRVCWWSPVAYHFSATPLIFFHPVTDWFFDHGTTYTAPSLLASNGNQLSQTGKRIFAQELAGLIDRALN